jgi:hypothetical protein
VIKLDSKQLTLEDLWEILEVEPPSKSLGTPDELESLLRWTEMLISKYGVEHIKQHRFLFICPWEFLPFVDYFWRYPNFEKEIMPRNWPWPEKGNHPRDEDTVEIGLCEFKLRRVNLDS